jgi:hypothetical protein
MWTKKERLLTFWLIYFFNYREVFLNSLDIITNDDLISDVDTLFNHYLEIYDSEIIAKITDGDRDDTLNDTYDKKVVFDNIATYEAEKIQYDSILSNLSNSWSKTPITIKSLLQCLLVELNQLKTSLQTSTEQEYNIETAKKLVGKYLKLTQTYVDIKNVSVIHAVSLKILKKDFSLLEEASVKD